MKESKVGDGREENREGGEEDTDGDGEIMINKCTLKH